MIKDIFVLNPKAWYTKLVEDMWKVRYKDFSHMCPFFWLCIFSIVITPIYYPIKWILVLPILFVSNGIGTYMDNKEENWRDWYYSQLKNNPSLRDSFIHKSWNMNCNRRYRNFYYFYLPYKDSNFLDLLQDLRNDYWNNKRGHDTNEVKPFINKDKINSIVRIVKPIMQTILVLIGAALVGLAIWGIYEYFIWLSNRTVRNWDIFWYRMKMVGIVSSILLPFIVLMIFLINRLNKVSCDTWERIFTPFKWVGVGVGKFSVLVYQMIKGSCPAIEWKSK